MHGILLHVHQQAGTALITSSCKYLPNMDSILISIVIITILIIAFKTLVSINNRDRKDNMSDLVHRFDMLEKEYNLNIYKKEILQHFIIGLDELHKELFVFKNVQDKYDFLIVHLKDISGCSKKKIYRSSMVQATRNRRTDKYLDKIIIEFEHLNGKERIQVTFYDSMINNSTEIFDLDKRADVWERELAETINVNLKKLA
jgi:hypothetical protein